MQKSLIALAVLSAIATTAQAQSSATIYGTVDTGVVFLNTVDTSTVDYIDYENINKLEVMSGVTQGSYMGFKGVEDLGSGLSASFELETGFSGNFNQHEGRRYSNSLFNRKSTVGLEGSLGSILLGHQPGVIDDINQSVSSAIGRPTDHSLDYSESFQSENSIRYDSPQGHGLSGSFTYSPKEIRGASSSGESYGVGIGYASGPMNLRAAYYEADRPTTSIPVPKYDEGVLREREPIGVWEGVGLSAYSLGASYHTAHANFYGSWLLLRQPYALGFTSTVEPSLLDSNHLPKSFLVGTDNNSKASVLKAGVDYSITEPLHLIADVSYTRAKYLCKEAVNPSHITQITLGADYAVSKRTGLYAFASNIYGHETFNPGIMNNHVAGDAEQIAIAVGVRHKF